MVIALVAAIIALYVFQSFFTKLYTDGYTYDKELATPVFTVITGTIISLISFCVFGSFEFDFNVWCIIIGVANAAALYGYNYFIVKCARSGPYSIFLTFSMSGGILFPIIAALIGGWDAWIGAPIIIVNSVSVLLVVFSVYLTSLKPRSNEEKTENGKITLSFILNCFALAVSNGLYAILVMLQQRLEIAGGDGNRAEMIIVTYVAAALISFGVILLKKKGVKRAFSLKRSTLAFSIGAGVVTGFAINLLMIAIPLVDATVFYTVEHALVLVFSVILSAFVFKEKITRVNIAGIVLMCIALAAMNFLPSILA